MLTSGLHNLHAAECLPLLLSAVFYVVFVWSAHRQCAGVCPSEQNFAFIAFGRGVSVRGALEIKTVCGYEIRVPNSRSFE
jgi:hypothetical protein